LVEKHIIHYITIVYAIVARAKKAVWPSKQHSVTICKIIENKVYKKTSWKNNRAETCQTTPNSEKTHARHLPQPTHPRPNTCLRTPLLDTVTEADEMYQNAGEKDVEHPDPNDPPRRRGNKTRGHGSYRQL
jgi:hypothetical protein